MVPLLIFFFLSNYSVKQHRAFSLEIVIFPNGKPKTSSSFHSAIGFAMDFYLEL